MSGDLGVGPVSDGPASPESGEIGAEWWWVCTDFFRLGGKVVAGPFADRDLALRFRTYYEAHPDARGRTFAVDVGPLALSGRSEGSDV